MTGYDDDVDRWTLAAVRAGPASFDDLVCQLPGVYPIDANRSLDRLRDAGRISDVEWRRVQQRRPQPTPRPSMSTLPVPHPLDFDWRFAHHALDALIDAGDRLVGVGVEVLCIGAPSLHQRLSTAGRRSTLLDANPDVIAAMATRGDNRAIQLRVGRDPLPAMSAPLVVIDPPWYPEHVRLFLWAASRVCADGGVVLLSFPPVGTRPGVADEQEDAIAYAAEVGLKHEDTRQAELAYCSPPFERLALSAAGYADLPEDWRRGDLIVFRAGLARDAAPSPQPAADDAKWTALPAEPTRIKVRVPDSGRPAAMPVASRLVSIIDGDVLPTVSRRDPRRSEVTVWTACNRVYACSDVEVLRAVAEAIGRDADVVKAAASALGRGLAEDEMHEVYATEAQLVHLLMTESRDLEACGWYTGGT